MEFRQRIRQLDLIIDPLAALTDSPQSAFEVPGRPPTSADRWSATHDQILLNSQHSFNIALTKLSLHAGDFRKIQLLGEGQFATVHIVHCHLDGQLYAMKGIEKHKAARYSQALQLPAERHLHDLASKCATAPAPALFAAFQSPSTLYLVMELASAGSLADRLEANSEGLDEYEVQYWTSQLVDAIAWVHQQGFVHRDVKPANILIAADDRLLLTDFGSAAPLASDQDRLSPQFCQEPVGTPDYIAPEVLKCAEAALVRVEQHVSYGPQCDWWSMGASVFELATGTPPFYSESIRSTYDAILAMTRLISTTLSDVLDDFLEGLLCDQLHRKTAPAIRRHSFLTKTGCDRPRVDAALDRHESINSFEADSTLDFIIDPSITQMGHGLLQRSNAQWYGWTRLPRIDTASLTSRPNAHNASVSLPKTPRRVPATLDKNHSAQRESRRQGMLACVQHSARKQRRNLAGTPRDIGADLEVLDESLQVKSSFDPAFLHVDSRDSVWSTSIDAKKVWIACPVTLHDAQCTDSDSCSQALFRARKISEPK